MANPKFFRVATEGATTDGRKISREDIVNMAATYDPATRAARVNVEHVKGVDPSGSFRSYGDVLALKTGEVELNVGGKSEKRLALYAQIKPLDNLKALNEASQKLYTSVEIQPNFASTGKAYLLGLAVTDNPASLGTEVLQFCAGKGADSFLAHRKSDPSSLFTAAEEADLDFSDKPLPNLPVGNDTSGLLAFFKQLLNFSGQQAAPIPSVTPDTKPAATVAPAASFASDPVAAAAFGTLMATAETSAAQVAELTQRLAESEKNFRELKETLETTSPSTFRHRPMSTAADDTAQADC